MLLVVHFGPGGGRSPNLLHSRVHGKIIGAAQRCTRFIFGMVYVPAQNITYYGIVGLGAYSGTLNNNSPVQTFTNRKFENIKVYFRAF